MARRLIYVGPDDDVSELAGKIQSATDGDEVAMVVPSGAQAFQTPLNLRLLRSVGAKRGITTALVGMSNVEHVRASLRLIAQPTATAEQFARLFARGQKT